MLGKEFEVGEYSEEDKAKCFFFMTQEEAEEFQQSSIFSTLASVVRTTVIDVDIYLAFQEETKADQEQSLVLKPKHSKEPIDDLPF